MRSIVDSEGKIALPEEIICGLGPTPGTRVDVSLDGERVIGTPAAAHVRLVRRGRFLIPESDEPIPTLPQEACERLVEEDRLERARQVLGL